MSAMCADQKRLDELVNERSRKVTAFINQTWRLQNTVNKLNPARIEQSKWGVVAVDHQDAVRAYERMIIAIARVDRELGIVSGLNLSVNSETPDLPWDA